MATLFAAERIAAASSAEALRTVRSSCTPSAFFATWPNAYFVTIDLNDINQNYREVGVVACALDRTNMLINGTPNSPQCFEVTSPLSEGIYLGHSMIPADVDGTTPPPSGRDEYMVSIQNPPIDGSTSTSGTFNLWDFHLN